MYSTSERKAYYYTHFQNIKNKELMSLSKQAIHVARYAIHVAQDSPRRKLMSGINSA